MGWGGHDCSKIVASFTPFTPIKPTQAPADNSSGLTPSNTYIRKYSFTFHTCPSIRNHNWKNIDDIWQSKRSAHICSRNDKYNWYIAAESTTPPKNKETRYEKDDQNTAGLVMALMLGVGFVFGAFATAALCYRLYKTKTFCVLSFADTVDLCRSAIFCRCVVKIAYNHMDKWPNKLHSNSLLICPCRKKKKKNTCKIWLPLHFSFSQYFSWILGLIYMWMYSITYDVPCDVVLHH